MLLNTKKPLFLKILGELLVCAPAVLFFITYLKYWANLAFYVWVMIWGLPKGLGGQLAYHLADFFIQKSAPANRKADLLPNRPPKN
jgi:hypothetical protein